MHWMRTAASSSVLGASAAVAALGSAVLRGVIRAHERGMLRWRVWAGARAKWTFWAEELSRRRRSRRVQASLVGEADPAEDGLVPHPQHREWAHGAALRWDVASSGFADELRGAASKASDEYHALQEARRRHSRRLELALGERRTGGGGALSIW